MFSVSKKDIIWGYFAQFFSIASGIITLPLILRLLSPEEIGMNYLMITVGALVTLFDFGFGPQISRNVTYIYSGAQKLKLEGIDGQENRSSLNYQLLIAMIYTTKEIYKRIGLVVLFILLSFGTYYIYIVTEKFTSVDNAALIWLIYSFSTFFNIYFSYYSSLLTGKGLITISRKAIVYSKILFIILAFLFLFLNLGLLGVALANLLSPFLNRIISYKYFFTKKLSERLRNHTVTKEEKTEMFDIIWYNAKKIGLISIASSSLGYLAMFVVGLYMNLREVASYGLLLQLSGIISTLSMTFFFTYVPKMSSLFIKREEIEFIKVFSLSMVVFFILYCSGSILFLIFGSSVLSLIKSNTNLPSNYLVALLLFFTIFEKNQSLFSQVFLFENKVPFLKVSIVTGLSAIILVYLSLVLKLGILGVILAQGIPTLLYAAWRWPLEICNKLRISISKLLAIGFRELRHTFGIQ